MILSITPSFKGRCLFVGSSIMIFLLLWQTAAFADIAISTFSASPTAFSPNNDGVEDTTTFAASIVGAVSIPSWTLSIVNGGGTTVRQFSGTGSAVSQIWNGTDSGGVVVPEGSFNVTLAVSDVAHTASQTISAIVDLTKPSIKNLVPSDHGNTTSLSQPLLATVTDAGGAGVVGATIVFQLLDDTSSPPTTTTFSGSSVTYSPATGWARTSPATLTLGHHYRFTVTANDSAGNSGSASQDPTQIGGGFRSIAMTFDSGQASLSSSGTDTGVNGSSPNTHVWSFFPAVHVSERTAHLPNGSQHVGYGTVASLVPLGTTRVQAQIAGVWQDWPSQVYGTADVRTVYQQDAYVDSNGGAQNITIAPSSVWLPSLSLDLPTTASAARLVLDPVTSLGSAAGICSDPSTGPAGCNPDPFHFYVTQSLINKISTLPNGTPRANIPSSPAFGILRLVPDEGYVSDPYGDTSSLDPGGLWVQVLPLESPGCTVYQQVPPTPLCLVSDGGPILYPVGYVVVPPSYFPSYCADVNFCSQADASTAQGNKPYCIAYTYTPGGRTPGQDRPLNCDTGTCYGGSSEKCQQETVEWGQQDFVRKSDVSNRMFHVFHAAWLSDWGVQDAPSDFLGMEFTAPQMKSMRWVTASQNDVRSWLELPIDASGSHQPFLAIAGGREVNVYPQNSAGEISEAERTTLINCYDLNFSKSEYNVEYDESCCDSQGGRATGFDTVNNGWPQYLHVNSCGSGGSEIYVRTDEIDMYGTVAQYDFAGAAHSDGSLVVSYGHWLHNYCYSCWAWYIWDFAVAAGEAGCDYYTAGDPSCQSLGMFFNYYVDSGNSSEDRKDVTSTIPITNAFSYS